ncbi:MAG TPA: hypothetical protein PK661_11510 [Syntrophorhabdaceae bacterium]|jgi:hypothetical protein|nr:hypothetical protein [Pseudomonadota bacterium]HOS60715.1 hypothetical protein [Syntrophorhabdaceae bacterium]
MGKLVIKHRGHVVVIPNIDLTEAKKLYWSYFWKTGDFARAHYEDCCNSVYL